MCFCLHFQLGMCLLQRRIRYPREKTILVIRRPLQRSSVLERAQQTIIKEFKKSTAIATKPTATATNSKQKLVILNQPTSHKQTKEPTGLKAG